VRREEAVGDGNGAAAPVGRSADVEGVVGLTQDGGKDDGVATGGTDDPAARLHVSRVFFVGRNGGELAEVVDVIFCLGTGNKKEMLRSVTVPLGNLILYERGASP
jgi:hypothetical protein